MPTLLELRTRVRRKLKRLGFPTEEEKPLARICHLIAQLASDEQATDLRSRVNPQHFEALDDLLLVVSQVFSEEIRLYHVESQRLIQAHFAHALGGQATMAELTCWWLGEQSRQFTALSFEEAW
jgi:hypothetical protein